MFGQIIARFGDPFVSSMPILEYMYLLRGIKYNQAKRCPVDKRSKISITPEILAKIHSVLAESVQDPDSITLWAPRCLCFFGFLRLGEITAPSVSHYDPSAHLTVKDVHINSRENPTVVKVLIKGSKTERGCPFSWDAQTPAYAW